jgi:hypothetical protein
MSNEFFWNGFKVRIDYVEDCDSYIINEPKVGDTVWLRVRCMATIVDKQKIDPNDFHGRFEVLPAITDPALQKVIEDAHSSIKKSLLEVTPSEQGKFSPFNEVLKGAEVMEDNASEITDEIARKFVLNMENNYENYMERMRSSGFSKFEFGKVNPIDEIISGDWSLNDPIPNVYVEKKIECPRHPDPNNVVSGRLFAEWSPTTVYNIGDSFIKDGVKCVITQTSSTYDVYKKPSEEG